ncbi:protein lin-9 homolog isoform X2 [Dysidea avara]|uniref:protein lin-9 homolog isoform X2 n=1 Tax=Dysidea avara TaxID=196820 RepID=UPI00332B5EA3
MADITETLELPAEDNTLKIAQALANLKQDSATRKRQGAQTRSATKASSASFHESPNRTPLTRKRSRKKLDFSDDSLSRLDASTASTEEDDEDALSLSNNKIIRLSAESPVKKPDPGVLHVVSERLRHILQLPKARQWCFYEWFYSDIDKPLFEGDNDFRRCLKELFPALKTTQLTRVQWRYIRRLLGKPRRCSASFFAQERAELEAKRKKIREIQKGLVTNFDEYRDLPNDIPQTLVIGTAVTARLPDHGTTQFFTGKVEAVDLTSHQYLVAFDRPGLGKHAVPDTEIQSAVVQDTLSIRELEEQINNWGQMAATSSANNVCSPVPVMSIRNIGSDKLDPLLSQSPARFRLQDSSIASSSSSSQFASGYLGGFPIEFLNQVAQTSKILNVKKEAVKSLRELNTLGEKKKAHGQKEDFGFFCNYATKILELEQINTQLSKRMELTKAHCIELGYGEDMIHPSLDMTTTCNEKAMAITLAENKRFMNKGRLVDSVPLIELVSRLSSLLLHVETAASQASLPEEFSLETSLQNIHSSLHESNEQFFQDKIEVPLALISSDLNPSGALHAFIKTQNTSSRQNPP